MVIAYSTRYIFLLLLNGCEAVVLHYTHRLQMDWHVGAVNEHSSAQQVASHPYGSEHMVVLSSRIHLALTEKVAAVPLLTRQLCAALIFR